MGHFRKFGITKSLRDSFSFWIRLGPLGFPFFGFFMLFLSDGLQWAFFDAQGTAFVVSFLLHRIYFLDPNGLVA